LTWRSLKPLLVKGAMAGAAGLLSVWILQGPLVLYAQIAADKASIGNLALVLQALVLCCTLPWAIGRAALPVLSRAGARQDGGQARFADVMLRLAFVFAGAAALAGLALGPPLMAWVFGAGYAEAGALLGPALWLLLPLTAATALNPLLMVRERYGDAALAALAGAAVMTGTVSILALVLGPLGAIAGAIAGAGSWAVCLLILVAQDDGVAMRLAILRPAIALTLAVFTYLAMAGIGADPMTNLLVACMVLLLATGGLCMTPAERHATAAFATKKWANIIGRLR
jgi:O-antigen/teichoic acid export membrane protein